MASATRTAICSYCLARMRPRSLAKSAGNASVSRSVYARRRRSRRSLILAASSVPRTRTRFALYRLSTASRL